MFKHALYFLFEFICLPLPLQLTYHSVFRNWGKKFTWCNMQRGVLAVWQRKSTMLHCCWTDKKDWKSMKQLYIRGKQGISLVRGRSAQVLYINYILVEIEPEICWRSKQWTNLVLVFTLDLEFHPYRLCPWKEWTPPCKRPHFSLPGEGGGCPALQWSALKGKERRGELLSPVERSAERYEQPEGKKTLREPRKLLGSGWAELTKFFPMHMPNT